MAEEAAVVVPRRVGQADVEGLGEMRRLVQEPVVGVAICDALATMSLVSLLSSVHGACSWAGQGRAGWFAANRQVNMITAAVIVEYGTQYNAIQPTEPTRHDPTCCPPP